MNAIEIRNLTKSFGSKRAVDGLNLTVPQGAICGFIGENGSGKSTTEKLICGLLHQSGGSIRLFGQPHTDPAVREKVGVLIEAPGCFGNLPVWDNLMVHATNLGLRNREQEVSRVLKAVRMEGAASNKFKNCSLGMKQRIGIAMALMGSPKLLVLDEPVNGLDADGMRILREILTNAVQNDGCTVLISSHILGELDKIATHYGIIRNGRLLKEMTAAELERDCPTFTAVKTPDMARTKELLSQRYGQIRTDERGRLRIYDAAAPQEVVAYLYQCGVPVRELSANKIGLEEYYTNLMQQGGITA